MVTATTTAPSRDPTIDTRDWLRKRKTRNTLSPAAARTCCSHPTRRWLQMSANTTRNSTRKKAPVDSGETSPINPGP